VPIVAAHWLGSTAAAPTASRTRGGWCERLYRVTMRHLLRHAWVVLLLVTPLGVLGYLAYQHVGSGFLPAMDEGGFVLDYVAPPGTSLTETDRLLRQVEAILRQHPAVQTYSRRTGLQMGGSLTEANHGDIFVRLRPFPRPPIEVVMEDVRQHIEHTVPGLQIETAQLMEDLIGDLTGVPQPIEIKLFAPDAQTLLAVAPKVAEAIQHVQGVVGVKNGIVLAGDALAIAVDRVQAALEGVDPDTVTKLVDNALRGNVTTAIQRGPKLVGVRVWVPADVRQTELDVRSLLLHGPNGQVFPLKRVAQVTAITGQPQITREDLRPMVAVTGRIAGRDLGSTIAEVQQVLGQPGLMPQGVMYALGGLYQQQQIAFRGLLLVMLAAIVLVFVLLLFLYERWLVALAILTVMLLGIACVLVGLWGTGTELNITSIMGMTMIVGIITEVAIFYVSEYAELPGEMPGPERLTVAGVQRARAIAMTTIAAILALLPLALGMGQGAAMLQPLAIAIIAGLLVQLPLVLVVLPALFILFRAG